MANQLTNIPAEPVVFSQSIEALFLRGLNGRVTPELEERLREVGVDLSKPLLPAYSFEIWNRALEVTARTLFDSMPMDEAYLEMGKRLVTSYQETLIGKALFGMLRVLSARKIIDRMARNFRTSNNFTETSVSVIGPNVVELHFNLVENNPGLTQGILAAGLPAAGVKGVNIVLSARDVRGATYRISWD